MILPRARSGGYLFFDLARVSGYAYAYPGEAPVSGEMEYPDANSWGRQTTAHSQVMWQMIEKYSPVMIGYEAPIRVKTDHQNNVRTAFGLSAETEAVAFQSDCGCISATPRTIRARVLHDGMLTKATAKGTVRRWTYERGWVTIGHNAADALVELTWAMGTRGVKPAMIPWTGHRFWRAELL